MNHIALIIGARPNFIKAFPVYEQLKNSFKLTLIHTGQHFDEKMSKVFFEQLKFPHPDIHLTLDKRTKAGDFDDKLYINNDEYLKNKNKVINELINYKGELGQLGEIRDKLKKEFEKIKPDLVIVFGDVTSTLAAALASKILNIEIAHIESGLRSGDIKMPEEVNRILTDNITKYYFVTESSGIENLKKSSISKNVYLVGNTMIDTQKKYLQIALNTKYNKKLRLKSKEYILVTLHRPSNVDNLKKFREIFKNLQILSKNTKLIYPIHPRAKKNLKKLGLLKKIKNNKNIILQDPLGYLEFTCLMANCKYLITDSGGLQEESTALNIPCFTLRENTERPSTLIENYGTNKLISKISEIQLKKCKGSMKLWDGKSSYKIYEILQIERHLKYRMSIFYNYKFENPNINKINFNNSFTDYLDFVNSEDLKVEKSGKRCRNLLDIIKNYSKNINFIINFTDGRSKPYGKSITNNNYDSKMIPFMVFNRHINIKSNCILFPLEGYQNFGCVNFKYYNDIKWVNKINKLIFRGSPTGYTYLNKSISFSSMIKILNKKIKENNINNIFEDKIFEFIYNNFPRFKFTFKFSKNNFINAGLTLSDVSSEKIYNYEYLYKDRMNIEEMLKYKYHILIDGNDWCSALPWILLHDCVAFMPETTYESIFTINLVPWKHFVPIRSDFEDLEEKIKYIINNDILAKKISYNSTLYMKQFTNIDLMNKIKIETIKRYCNNCKI